MAQYLRRARIQRTILKRHSLVSSHGS
jgi:hypothetical protein